MKLKDKLARLASVGMNAAPPAPAVEEAIDEETGEVLRPSHVQPITGDRAERLSKLRSQLAETVKRAEKRSLAPAPRASWVMDEDAPAPHLRESGPLPGVVEDTEHGAMRRVVTRYDEDHRHGSVPVALALESCARDLSLLALDPTLEGIYFTKALYIDTETTGLAGGAGTLPFLVGMAWFEGRELVVEQLLLERPGLEKPMLQRFAALLSASSCVVSYNGKSFDWPLLRTRFVLNRVAAPKVVAHLDLLHCARRVYKRRLGPVRLVLRDDRPGVRQHRPMPGQDAGDRARLSQLAQPLE